MAILGTWVDRAAITLAGLATSGFVTTINHSVPTIPDSAFVNLVSAQASSVPPAFGVQRGTVNTLIAYYGTLGAGSAPTTSLEVTSLYYLSAIR